MYFIDLDNSNEVRTKIESQYDLFYNGATDIVYYKKYIEYYYAEIDIETKFYRSKKDNNFKIIVCSLKKRKKIIIFSENKDVLINFSKLIFKI